MNTNFTSFGDVTSESVVLGSVALVGYIASQSVERSSAAVDPATIVPQLSSEKSNSI